MHRIYYLFVALAFALGANAQSTSTGSTEADAVARLLNTAALILWAQGNTATNSLDTAFRLTVKD